MLIGMRQKSLKVSAGPSVTHLQEALRRGVGPALPCMSAAFPVGKRLPITGWGYPYSMTHHDSDEAHNARRPEAAAFDYDKDARLANGGVDEAVYVRRLRLLLRRYIY